MGKNYKSINLIIIIVIRQIPIAMNASAWYGLKEHWLLRLLAQVLNPGVIAGEIIALFSLNPISSHVNLISK